MISYAQNFEDVLLHRCFGKTTQGFYVDIGAYHPVIASVTKIFYDAGWSGINIEPGSGIVALRRERPRDINLAIAITDSESETDFWEHTKDPGTSTLLADVVPAIAEKAGERIHRRVPTLSLALLLERHAADKHIHFLKIDAEGSEDAIVSGGNWKTHRPEIIVIESTEPYSNRRYIGKIWQETLTSANYTFAYFDGVNDFWVRAESASLLDAFTLPVNVLDGFTVYDPEIKQLKSTFTKETKQLKNTLAKARESNSELGETIAKMREEFLSSERHGHELEETIAKMREEFLSSERHGRELEQTIAKMREEFLSSERHSRELVAALGREHELTAHLESQRLELEKLLTDTRDRLILAEQTKSAAQDALAVCMQDLNESGSRVATLTHEVESLRRSLGDLQKWRLRFFRKLRSSDAPRELRMVLPLARTMRLVVGKSSVSPEFQPLPSGELVTLSTKKKKSTIRRKIKKRIKSAAKPVRQALKTAARKAVVPVAMQMARRSPKLFAKIRKDIRRQLAAPEIPLEIPQTSGVSAQVLEDAMLTLALHDKKA